MTSVRRTLGMLATCFASRLPLTTRRRVRRGMLALMAVAGALFGSLASAPIQAQGATPPPTVAVMYFDNGALVSRDEYEPMRKGMADLLIAELLTNPRIRVIERAALQALLDEQQLTEAQRTDPATSVRLGKLLGAQHLVLGGFFVDRKGRLRLDARAVNVETSKVEHAESVQGSADAVLDVIADLARRLNAGLKLPGRPEGARGAPGSPPSGVPPFRALVTYSRALEADDARETRQALVLYRQFLSETAPTFAVAQRRHAEERVRVLSEGETR